MFDRLPLPSQFDRIIVAGGTIALLTLGPLFVILLALLIMGTITAPEMVFYLAAFVILAGALGSVLLSNLVHAALSLIATLLGVAAIFLLLLTEFLALVQVLVYGGGVVILLLFGLMLTNAQDDPIVTDGSQKPFAFGIAAIVAGVFITAFLGAQWGDPSATAVPFREFGARLFRDFTVPIIVVAVLLDIALTGAFVNARRADEETEAQDAAPEEARA